MVNHLFFTEVRCLHYENHSTSCVYAFPIPSVHPVITANERKKLAKDYKEFIQLKICTQRMRRFANQRKPLTC